MAKQTDKTDEERPAAPAHNNYFSTGAAGRGWLYGLAAVIILILVFAAGVAVSSHRHRDMVFKSGNVVRGPGGEFGIGSRRGFGPGDLGDSVTNGQTRVSGVVTSVNDNGFTVAGNGSTTNVTTNSSTQYEDGNQVKQNDTVMVLGTENNGTLTATRIVINP